MAVEIRSEEDQQDADRNVTLVVKMLLDRDDMTYEQLGHHLGLTKSTMTERMSGAPKWRVREVAVMSGLFKVPVSVFYEGPAVLASGYRLTPLSVVESEAGEQMELAFVDPPVLVSA